MVLGAMEAGFLWVALVKIQLRQGEVCAFVILIQRQSPFEGLPPFGRVMQDLREFKPGRPELGVPFERLS